MRNESTSRDYRTGHGMKEQATRSLSNTLIGKGSEHVQDEALEGAGVGFVRQFWLKMGFRNFSL
jgi:hypothetical protein